MQVLLLKAALCRWHPERWKQWAIQCSCRICHCNFVKVNLKHLNQENHALLHRKMQRNEFCLKQFAEWLKWKLLKASEYVEYQAFMFKHTWVYSIYFSECHKNLLQCSVLLGIAVICHAQMQSFCSISSQWCDPGLLSSIRLRLFHAILVWNQIIPSVYFLLEIELTLCAHSVLKTVYNQIVHLTTQLINLVLFLASVTTVLTVFVFLVLLFYNYFEWRI